MDSYYSKEVMHHQWILSNRRGSYAMGFGDLINDRKYDGLLIASDDNLKRTHLVYGAEEEVEWRGNKFFLDSNSYSNCIYPDGYEYIIKTWLRPYPSFLFSSNPANEEILILKEIMMDENENITLVKYSNIGSHPMHISVKPKLTMVEHHTLNSPGSLDNKSFSVKAGKNGFTVLREDNGAKLYGCCDEHFTMKEEKIIYRNIFFSKESSRGYDYFADVISLFSFEFEIFPNESRFILYSDFEIENIPYTIKKIQKRYSKYSLPKDHPLRSKSFNVRKISDKDENLFEYSEYMKILNLAMEDFILDDNIIAGFPWFSAWGRDTFISMEAMFYMKNKENRIKRIFKKYGESIKGGFLPNTFGEGGEGMNYDSADSPLWFIIRMNDYEKMQKVSHTLKKHIDYAQKIILDFINRKDTQIIMDEDALLLIKEGPLALTWMDAKIFDTPVTGRFGKPVEINALWYSAIMSFIEMCKSASVNNRKKLKSGHYKTNIIELMALTEKIKRSAIKFVYKGVIQDRLVNDIPTKETRPNALIAISLNHKLWKEDIMEATLLKAKNELLTEYGIRTLSMESPGFKRRYIGDENMRNYAYHNGTVWAYLLLPYAKAYYDIYKGRHDKLDIKREIGSVISTFRNGFQKGHIASIAEVWDGDKPHFPKGCHAQAWSVAMLLTVENMIKKMMETD